MRALLAAYAISLAILIAVAVTGGVLLYDRAGPDDAVEAAADRHGYDLVSWELRHATGKWIYKAGHLFEADFRDRDDEKLRRYLSLAADIRVLEQEGNSVELSAARNERADLEADVEDIIEGRVTAILEGEGLALEPPLFDDLGLIFPPVDFELDSPPRVLVISPRDRIEFDRSYLLAAGLGLETAAAIEGEAESADAGVSALVTGTGGVATYPSIISELASYESLIDTVCHEWLHQYLVFFPLGFNYTESSELRTLNESVANLGGHELARLYFERYGRLAKDSDAEPSPTAPAGGFDFTTEMRDLRRRVEDLLERGRIEEAESLMSQKRGDFETKGVYIRRLNQAYFAFHGFYADTPGSIDPIGPKLQTLLERAGSPGEFVRRAAGITSERELDELLD